jgi:hypothetical protein
MEHSPRDPQPLDINGLFDPGSFADRLIFDPVEPGGAVSACAKCGKCGKSARDDLTLEDDLNELKRHIYRNPEILRDIMDRWNIVPPRRPPSDQGPNP